MDDWSSFRTTTSEQQRLRAALSGFCESQDLPEEQRAAYTAYLRKRIRPAVEMLIREDDFSKLERILQTGWLSDADRKRFLNLAADQQKWQAFRILLNRSSQDPMQENTESRKTEAAFQKEKPTKEKEALALRLFEEARKNLCWLYPELGEAILFFQHQPSDRTKAITSDGHTIYFNSDFVLCMCAENSSFLKEGYQHLLLECILAVLVLKSTSIAAKALAAADRNVRLAAIATASWRSGTWYSPSLILTATATMNACQNQTSIPVWVWNVWLALCRMSATCSR